jgi:hypothetical protein
VLIEKEGYQTIKIMNDLKKSFLVKHDIDSICDRE